jgi:hypothetical protein
MPWFVVVVVVVVAYMPMFRRRRLDLSQERMRRQCDVAREHVARVYHANVYAEQTDVLVERDVYAAINRECGLGEKNDVVGLMWLIGATWQHRCLLPDILNAILPLRPFHPLPSTGYSKIHIATMATSWRSFSREM